MKSILLCIINNDPGWAKAFLRTVSLDYPGYSVTFKPYCDENCEKGYDICLDLNFPNAAGCRRAIVPACGKQAGVTALLAEAKKHIALQSSTDHRAEGDFSIFLGAGEVDGSRVVCVHSRLGGVGTSCASIGIGRELARYREIKTAYICLTDIESVALLPACCSAAMLGDELLYRCLRTAGKDESLTSIMSLIRAAFISDEYGMLRLGVNPDLNALSMLSARELAGLLSLIDSAVGPLFFVIDFGTRKRLLNEFCEICDTKNIQIDRSGESGVPECPEDVRYSEGKIDIALTNAFGLKIKELCDGLWS